MIGTTTFEEELERYGNLVYTNVGNSMMPLLRPERDLVEIVRKSPHERCNKYDIVLYKRGKKYILHRVLKVTPDGYVIAGDHNYIKEYDITDKQILGILTAVVRNGKRLCVDNVFYKIYTHLWCDFYHVRAAVLLMEALARHIVKNVLLCKRRRENEKEIC